MKQCELNTNVDAKSFLEIEISKMAAEQNAHGLGPTSLVKLEPFLN